MRSRIAAVIGVLILAVLACAEETNDLVLPTSNGATSLSAVEEVGSAFDTNDTAFGFFPSPPEPTLESVLQHFEDLGDHADFILIQANIPWEDFVDGVGGESKARTDIRNQMILANQNGLEAVFVVDSLNGLNRREFFDLPAGWDPTFSNPEIRQAFINFSSWILQEFEPNYIGLGSEINTYMDAHPDDAENFLSLYRETYASIKDQAPETQVFVSFQWDDLRNMFPEASEGRQPGEINWDQVEAFEPQLDLWVISSYPYFAFNGGTPIPDDYYTPLLERTDKPLAVAEGGFSSEPVGPIQADPRDQVGYLEAIHDQIGERLDFWVYILLNDIKMDAFREAMRAEGRAQDDIETLSFFATVGLRQADGEPKPALELWDQYRQLADQAD